MSIPVFDNASVTVIFVLGGPGAGKGTQCSKLVDAYNFCHLSGIFTPSFSPTSTQRLPAGDLLREEQNRPGSQYGELIRTNIRDGKIVPSYVTLKLLEVAMAAQLDEKSTSDDTNWKNGRGRFLIDGFPRKMDQAELFDYTVSKSPHIRPFPHSFQICLSALVLFYDTTEEVLTTRLLERAKTSGREDDNLESILKRFRTYKLETMPVIERYEAQNKVVRVSATLSFLSLVSSTMSRSIAQEQLTRSTKLLPK